MGSAVLSNITAPDQYTSGSTVQLRGGTRVTVDVSNQMIYWQVATGELRVWEPETPMAPGSRTIFRRNITGFRVRAYIPLASLPAGQTQAQVTASVVS